MSCEQLTLVLSDISPIDIAAYLYLYARIFITCNVVENVSDIQQEQIRNKIKSFHRLSDQS